MPPPKLTHFLCLPLVTQASKPQLQFSLQHFASAATSTYDVPPKALRPIGTIHLTLGVMQLADERQVEAAASFLRSLDVGEMLERAGSKSRGAEWGGGEGLGVPVTTDPESGSREAAGISEASGANPETETWVAAGESEILVPPLVVSMSGLESMHTPTKTSILYTSPKDPTSRLLVFAASLRDAFTDANLLLPDRRLPKLHATIVNTLYAKVKGRRKGAGHGKDNRGVGKLDATALLEEFRDFEWAREFHIEKVSICQMGAKREVVDGVVVNEEYVEVAGVSLP